MYKYNAHSLLEVKSLRKSQPIKDYYYAARANLGYTINEKNK